MSEVCMARTHEAPGGFHEKVQEVAADGVVVGLGLDAPAVMTEVVPIRERRSQRCEQPIGDFARAGRGVIDSFRGKTLPMTETAVRSTSIGWADAGSVSSAAAHARVERAERPELRFVGA